MYNVDTCHELVVVVVQKVRFGNTVASFCAPEAWDALLFTGCVTRVSLKNTGTCVCVCV